MLTRLSTYALCRGTVAFVWLYHGLVPKLLGPHEDELSMNQALGLSVVEAHNLALASGVAEAAFGLSILLFWNHRWPLLITAASMVGLLLFAALSLPSLLLAAFNPLTTNLCVFVLAIVALRLHGHGVGASAGES